MNRWGQGFANLVLPLVTLVLGGDAGTGSSIQTCRRDVWAAVAYCSAEPVQCFGEKHDSFLSKDAVVTNTQPFVKGLCALFGW